MDVGRMLAVLEWAADGSQEYRTALQELVAAYTAVRDNPGDTNALTTLRDLDGRIRRLCDVSSVNTWVPSKRRMLSELGGLELFGQEALERLEDAMDAGRFGLAGTVSALTESTQEVTAFVSNANQVVTTLAKMGVHAHVLGPNEFEAGILIPEAITAGQYSGLRDILDDWALTIKIFLELSGDKERDTKISGLATGSFEFFAQIPNEWTAVSIIIAIERITQFYKTILEVRILRLQLAEKGAPVEEQSKIKKHEESLLEEKLEAARDEIVSRVTATITATRKNELKNGLSWALRSMARMIDRGIDLEVSLPEEPITDEEPLPEEMSNEERATVEQQRQEALDTRRGEWSELRAQGAAVAKLPDREEPVFQLPPPAKDRPPSKLADSPTKKTEKDS